MGLAACAAKVHVGAFDVYQVNWEHGRKDVLARAAFEAKCPEAQLTAKPIAVSEFDDALVSQIAVEGCGHRLVYVASHSGWVLNSSDGQAK